ncbi:hypothetical protein [Flavobacterium hydrophilum]|uniref:SPOR domain-containing protein n=1 Tax=Flavobacterium hydrophilum TaxID=2211445 RepID=A0A2V4C8C8_9FLAO|nr:hypothetical protein [Flavobacterium hydrophilum]PXY46892.1 hypothetical protein DMB68_07030 [Flavobacterium hydrophilum]
MTKDELDIKRFELEHQVQIEELELKKKELDLKIQEQRSKTIFTPVVISIVGGLITLITGIVLKYYDNKAITELEDKKFQSTLLLKATEAKNYEEFSDMLLVFQDNGLLSLDSAKILSFRRKRFIADKLKVENTFEQLKQLKKQQIKTDTIIKTDDTFYWTIVAGGDANLKGAKFEQAKSLNKGFKNVDIWYRQNSYRTCIGKYLTYENAVSALFDVKEQINNTSYIIRFDKWCNNSKYDKINNIYICQ